MLAKELINEDYVKIDKNEPVSKLIGLLKRTGKKAALVFDKKKFVGVSTKNLLIKTRIDPTKLKVGKVILKVPILHGSETVEEVARLLYTSNSPILPVVIKNILKGVLDSENIIKLLKNSESAGKSIDKLINRRLLTLNEGEKLGKAIAIMKEKHISRIPILDNKENLSGIICLRDIIDKHHLFQQGKSETHGNSGIPATGPRAQKEYKAERADFNVYPIDNLATTNVITVEKTATVAEVVSKMEKNSISCVVAVENKKPIGIITSRDLLRLFLRTNISY